MNVKKILTVAIGFTLGGIALFPACTKNSNPQPVHDTLYATKPDSTVNLTKGLLLYLPFSGNIADSSGNGNPTTAYGTVLTYDVHGYANNAFGSTGAGEHILVTNNGSIKFDTAWSLSFAFMTNSINAHQYYISMVDPVTGKGPSFVAGVVLDNVGNFAVGTEDVSLGCNNYGTNDNINITDTTSLVPVPGSWYNAVAIYHKGSVQVYINGKLISTKTGSGTAAEFCPSSQIVIGGWWNGGLLNLNGKLDNIRLYNRVLTPHEITTLAANYQVNSNQVKPGIKTHE